MKFLRKEWREVYKAQRNIYDRSAILRVLLIDSRDPSEIFEVVERMEKLPIGLQSYIAWDVVCNPATTPEIYSRVKRNRSLLAMTDIENIQFTWKRNHVCV